MNRREQLAKDNGMTIEFVNWFFDNKKDGCGNAWLVMMAAMWESWKYLSEQRDALAAEVYDVKHPGAYLPSKCETPATDAFLREVRAQARSEGINYAASRLAAAFNHGFVDKPVKEVADVVRMILTAKEDLANDALPAPDALSGEYAEQALEGFAAELRKSGGQSTRGEIPLPVERELLMALRKGGAA